MHELLGLDIGIAQERLQSVGVRVLIDEISSKKGVEGADAVRVVRALETPEGVRLTVARFRTEAEATV